MHGFIKRIVIRDYLSKRGNLSHFVGNIFNADLISLLQI